MFEAVQSGMFASKLRANMRGCLVTIDALGPLEEKPAAPRAIWPDEDESMFVSLVPPHGQPSDQHRMPARAAENMATPRQEVPPPTTHMVEAIGSYGMSTASQRKLNICKFNGTELYKGLGSKFLYWRRTFMRAVSLAEAS